MAIETVAIDTRFLEGVRLKRCLSVDALAHLIGCSAKTARKMLRGGPVLLGIARRTANAIGVPVSDLVKMERLRASA